MRLKWRGIVSGVAAVLLVTIAGIVIWGVRRHADSGWYSAWASAGSTVIAVLALIAASVAAVATVETNRNQSEQLNRLEESQKSDRASKFAVWRYRDPNDSASSDPETVIYFHNAGPLPVYAVRVFFLVNGNEDSRFVGTLPPTDSPTRLTLAEHRLRWFISKLSTLGESIPDSYSVKQTDAMTDPAEKARAIKHNNEVSQMRIAHESAYRKKGLAIEISVEFSDGESNWRRHASGRLEHLPDTELQLEE